MDAAWSASEIGNFSIEITQVGWCPDDEFEDDDTKDTATDHGENGTWTYALCSNDNPDGQVQPGDFTSIDWSVVTIEPWSILSVSTHGTGNPTNDIDLFVESYDGDGICDWGGGDDLAGSGSWDSEEFASFTNLSDESLVVYVGTIYYSGENPIPYELTIETNAIDCPACPRDLTAFSAASSIELNWLPGYAPVPNSRQDSEFNFGPETSVFARDFPRSKKALHQKKKAIKLSGLSADLHDNAESVLAYNRGVKTRLLNQAHRLAPPVINWTIEDYIHVTQVNRHNALRGSQVNVNSGTRDTEVTIEVCIDEYASEGSWNVYDYSAEAFLYEEAKTFSESFECQVVVESLSEGMYSVDSWDSYGDGGQAITVSIDEIVITEGLSEGLYSYLDFEVTDGTPSVYGCMDSDACNYNPDANEDDGSCCYDNCLIMTMYDSYGDGWNGAEYTITDENDNEFANGGLLTGSEDEDELCLEDGNYVIVVGGGDWDSEISWSISDGEGNLIAQGDAGTFDFSVGGELEIWGCTDPSAANYNPDATMDDGSCVGWGEDCDYPLAASSGFNESTGEDQWFHYTVENDGGVTITSQDDTGEAIFDTYLYVLGSCETDDDGNYTDLLAENDDCCGYYGPSTVELNVTAGQELFIYWFNAWNPGPFPFTIMEGEGFEECVDDEFEDNDSFAEPVAIEPGDYNLQICIADADWFSIMVNNGQELTVSVTDINETEELDLGIFALEIDPGNALDFVADQNEMEVSYANNLDHATEFLIMVRDWYELGEGPYSMSITLEDFEQTTYTVYRDGDMLAEGILLTEYSDVDLEPNMNYCYTVTANLPGAESGASNEACETFVYIPPPDPPYNVIAEGGWYDLNGEDVPSITWSWDYDYPELTGTPVFISIQTDQYGNETSWEITTSGGQLVESGGNYDSNSEYDIVVGLEDGDYTFTIYDSYGDGMCCAYGQGSYSVELEDGTVIASGGEFESSESTDFIIGGNRDGMGSSFDLNNGSFEFEHGQREIVFELEFMYNNATFNFQTQDTVITIYGFMDGDFICGTVVALDNNLTSDPSDEACAYAGGLDVMDVEVTHLEVWDMVSLAVDTDMNHVSEIFTNYVSGTLYEWDGTNTAVTSLELGKGYWLRFESAGTDIQSGLPVDDLEVELMENWNMIGSVSYAGGISDVNGIVVPGTVYGFPYSDPVAVMEPGNGYWIRTTEAGTVSISTGSFLPKLSNDLNENKLNINGLDLYFGVELAPELSLSYGLPPKPPAGIFDVRFSGDTRLIQDEGIIEIKDSPNDISIDYSVLKPAGTHKVWVLTTQGNEEFILDGMGSITLNGHADMLTLKKQPVIPKAFGLSQNFPNPFNPVTHIQYQLPEASHVVVSVFNITGQKLADLVNENKAAGFHEVIWDSRTVSGGTVSSGVYFYTLTAGSYHSLNKMILMK